jgi:hypothetical protein
MLIMEVRVNLNKRWGLGNILSDCPWHRGTEFDGQHIATAMLLLLLVCHAGAQTPPGPVLNPGSAKKTSQPTSQRPPASVDQWAEVDKRLAEIEQTLSRSSVETRLAAIEDKIADLKHSSLLSTMLPSIIAALAGLLGVLIGGISNERLQRGRLRQEEAAATAKAQQERELSQKQAKLQIGNAVVEWQLKQLSLLYGPLRALLGQSFGLYREMNNVLLTHADHFRLASPADATDPDKKVFQIKTSSGEWRRYRTVIDISQVYGQGFGVEAYFDEIVSIGARIMSIIEQHAGYARPEQKNLMEMFAKYLAHFAVLKSVHEEAKGKLSPKSEGEGKRTAGFVVNLSAAFPEDIHKLIDEGFVAITGEIEQWRQKAVA